MDNTATLTWFSGNYGSIMQAFALQNKIIALGYNNDIINYVPDKMENYPFFVKALLGLSHLKQKFRIKKFNLSF